MPRFPKSGITPVEHDARDHSAVASTFGLGELATKAHSSLTGVGADDHHAQAHTLTSHSTKAHSELTGIGASDHHTSFTTTDHDARDHSAVANTFGLSELATKAHSSLTGIGADDHHAQSHTLTSHSTKAHSELTGVGASDHHTAFTSTDHASVNHSALTGVGKMQLMKAQSGSYTNTTIATLDSVALSPGYNDGFLVLISTYAENNMQYFVLTDENDNYLWAAEYSNTSGQYNAVTSFLQKDAYNPDYFLAYVTSYKTTAFMELRRTQTPLATLKLRGRVVAGGTGDYKWLVFKLQST